MVRQIILLLLTMSPALADTFPGGVVEPYGLTTRARYSLAQLAAFVPETRTAFSFPAPYSTRGIRLTQPSDCTGNQDCVNYIGYSYWANMNAHEASNEILIYVGLSSARGGTGLQLLRYNKTTEAITLDGPIFNAGAYRNMDCTAGCYFSGTLPTKLYFVDGVAGSKQLVRYDVISKVFETVWDIRDGTLAGCDFTTCPYTIYQPHSSVNDAYHSFTLRDAGGNKMGCLVKKTTAPVQTFWYPRIANNFDECMLEKAGAYTISLEYDATVPGSFEPTYNRFFDNATGAEVNRVTGPNNTLGHAETGYNYIVGADNYYPAPPDRNATIYYVFPNSLGGAIHYNPSLNVNAMQHPTHLNAKPGLPQRLRMICGSDASTFYSVQNEITCVRMDGSGRQLIVAPIMTDPNASGGAWQGAPYSLQPKGNIDVSGRYFIWTTNLGGNRLDAFLVKIPADKFDEANDFDLQASRASGRVEGAILGKAPRGLTLTFMDGIEGLLLLASLIKYRALILWAFVTGYRRAGQKVFEAYWRYKVKRWLREAPLMIEDTITIHEPIKQRANVHRY